jgi:hypothetical protein
MHLLAQSLLGNDVRVLRVLRMHYCIDVGVGGLSVVGLQLTWDSDEQDG